jgi:HlyD family secretion protein
MQFRAALLILLLACGSSPPPLELSGTVEAHLVRVGSTVGGRVAAVHVEEGASVRAGDVLVTLETKTLDPQLREQRARVAEAGAAAEELRAGPRSEEVRRAEIAWKNAERERTRLEELLAAGAVSQKRYDDAADESTTRLEALRELERGTRAEEIAKGEASLERERAHEEYLERLREESVVRASVDGVVQSLDLRSGDLVAPDQPVASLLDPGDVWIRVYVPEPELGRVRLGQEARVKLDTYPEHSFSGSVVEIRDRAEYTPRNLQTREQRSEEVFGVKVRVDPDPRIKPGMTASVVLVEPEPAR